MIGDRSIPKPYQTNAAQDIFNLLGKLIRGDRPIVAIAGESGSGKTEIAFELARISELAGRPAYIFQQDDYFFYPPHTNAARRRKNISHVGLTEVNLRLLDEHLSLFRQAPAKFLRKPVVIFHEDRVVDETIDPNAFGIGIVEGTYTSLLNHVSCRVFIARSHQDTLKDRVQRQREELDEFTDRVLEIEHNIISKHRSFADIVVNGDFSVSVVSKEKKKDKKPNG